MCQSTSTSRGKGLSASLRSGFQTCESLAERIFTLGYHELLQRNTVEPLSRVIEATADDTRLQLLHNWSLLKIEESKYIQLAVRVYKM